MAIYQYVNVLCDYDPGIMIHTSCYDDTLRNNNLRLFKNPYTLITQYQSLPLPSIL